MTQRESGRPESRSILIFMAATAMATTISTLTATAMVQADQAQPVAVTCDCTAAEATPAALPLPPAPPVQPAIAAPEPEPDEPIQTAEPEPDEPIQTAEPRASRVQPATMKVAGTLDEDVIRRIVRAHINEVRYCYNQGLAEDPELSGRVVVEMKIDGTGTAAASVDSTDLEGDVPQCIADAASRWAFPRPADGGTVVVHYPFVLEAG